MKLKKIWIMMFVIVISLIIIDQLSKVLIDNFITEDKKIISNVFVITKIENEGVAFGLIKRKF